MKKSTQRIVFYKVPQLAHRWGVSAVHVHRLIKRGVLQGTRFGRTLRIAATEVARFEKETQKEGRTR